LQHRLQARMPKLLAIIITVAVCVAVTGCLGLQPSGTITRRRRGRLSGAARHLGDMAWRSRRLGRRAVGRTSPELSQVPSTNAPALWTSLR
jgi:hypothetical protein